MKCFQSCQECPLRIRETNPKNDCVAGDFEYYLVVRSVDYAAVRLGYGWPIQQSNGDILMPECYYGSTYAYFKAEWGEE